MSRLEFPNRMLPLWGSLTALFVWSYWSTLLQTIEVWRLDPDHTHGFLVLPIALAIWMRRRDRFEELPSQPSLLGLVCIAAASLLRIVAARFYIMPLDVWSIPLWLGGVIWTFGGRRAIVRALPALAFLWFAAPLPDRVAELLSLPLQELAATASGWVLQMLNQPAVAAGTTLLLGAESFEVEHACSGLRMFLGTFAMATAFALLSGRGPAVNVSLILLAAPIAISANILRIVITALLYQHASTEVLRRFVHDFAGLMMVGTVFGSYVLTVYAIGRATRAYKANRDRFFYALPLWSVTVLALVIVVVLWQGRQQRRVFASLLDTAEFYEQSEEWRRAADYLDRYLQLHQDDSLALRRLANAIDRSARNSNEQQRALTLLTAAWKANPNDLELAIRQAELAWDLRQLGQAIATTTAILQHTDVDQPEQAAVRQMAARLRAWSMYESLNNSDEYSPFTWTDVAEALTVASRWDVEYPQHVFRLAIVYRERLNSPSPSERAKMADDLIDGLVREQSESAEAWLIRYRYRRRFQQTSAGDAESMDADLQRALALDERSEPRNVHILVAAAERARERGDTDTSLALYQTALQANARDARPYLAIAEIWTERSGAPAREKAVEVLQQGLAIIGSDEVPLMFPLIEQLVVLERIEEADAVIAQAERATERFPDPVRTSYRIQLQHVKSWRLAKDGDYIAAARSLEELLDALPLKYVHSASRYVAQSWANVGQYYRMASEWDRATEIYQRAAALDDVWRLEHRWTLARRSELHGDLSDAAAQYREIATRSEQPLNAWIQAAAVALRQQVLLPEPIRDWTYFRRAIDAARPVAGDDMDQVIVMEANQLLVLGQDARVTRLLLEAIKEYPESAILWRSLALVQARRGDLEGALKIAESIDPLNGDRLASVLLQKELLADANRHDQAIELLSAALLELMADRPIQPLDSAGSARSVESPEQVPDAITLQLELAWLCLQRARWDEARHWMDQAKQANPRDLRVIEALSELAWCREDWKLLDECEASLREIEGTYGPLWRTLRIRRLLAQSRTEADGAAPDVEEIDQLASQLEVLYPHLQQTRIAAGRVATYRGLLWRAVANYEEAWEMGLPRVSLAVDLVGLLNELGETDRAQRYVHEVRRFLTATHDVIDQSFLDLDNESADDAIRMAEALVQDSPRSDSYLRLGRTLVLTALPQQGDYQDRLRRAEMAFRQAVDLNPTDVRAWAALFRYLVAVKSDPIESQAVFRSLAERDDITPLNRAFVLAQLHESVENHVAADQMFRESLQLAEQQAVPAERLIVLERAAQYFRRTDPQLSEQCCRQALAIDASSVGPRQILLELLLAKQTRDAALEATRLVESLNELGMGSDAWKRLRARVLLHALPWDEDPHATRRAVVNLLDDISAKSSADALLLCDLYLVNGQRTAALAELRAVSKQVPDDGDLVLQFLRQFDQQLYADSRSRTLAEQIYDQLEEQPQYGLAALDLRCETAATRAEGTYVQRNSLVSSLIHRYLRRAIERSETEQDQFHEVVLVMQHLIATGRWEEARQLTRLSPGLLPTPRSAVALATALATSDPQSEDVQRLVPTLDAWLDDFPNDPEMLFAIANLRLMWDDNQAAIALFRRGLAAHSHHAPTMNNLAIALATDDLASLDECFELVEQVIELEGRQPQWLDTLAVLHLLRGESDAAINLLLEALPYVSQNELLFLHLAKAWLEQGDLSMARFALDVVESGKLQDQVLMPLDRRMYEEVVGQLRESAR